MTQLPQSFPIPPDEIYFFFYIHNVHNPIHINQFYEIIAKRNMLFYHFMFYLNFHKRLIGHSLDYATEYEGEELDRSKTFEQLNLPNYALILIYNIDKTPNNEVQYLYTHLPIHLKDSTLLIQKVPPQNIFDIRDINVGRILISSSIQQTPYGKIKQDNDNTEINITVLRTNPDMAIALKTRMNQTPEQILNALKPRHAGMFSELVFNQSFLLRRIPLGRQGVTQGSVLYLINKQRDIQSFKEQKDAPIHREQTRLADLHQTRNENRPTYYKKVARYMKEMEEKRDEENMKRRRRKETKYEKPNEMSSQPLPKFW